MIGPSWERIVEGNTVKITLQDCIEALSVAKSLATKELETNRIIKENPTLKEIYTKHLEVLSVIHDKFEAVLMKGPATPRRIIPGSRR